MFVFAPYFTAKLAALDVRKSTVGPPPDVDCRPGDNLKSGSTRRWTDPVGKVTRRVARRHKACVGLLGEPAPQPRVAVPAGLGGQPGVVAPLRHPAGIHHQDLV